MKEKTVYKSQNREELLSFLSSRPNIHFTVAELVSHFQEEGRPIGTTTVYRQLERLCEEGMVNKYIIDQNTPACFSYVGKDTEGGEACSCFHCKCNVCGKLIHLHCHELDFMMEHLITHHGFHWDEKKTVFYGLCADCAQTQRKGASE